MIFGDILNKALSGVRSGSARTAQGGNPFLGPINQAQGIYDTFNDTYHRDALTPYSAPGPQVAGPQGAPPDSGNYDGGGSGGGGGGYAAYDANTDPTRVAQTRADVFGQRGSLDNLYNSIYGGVNELTQERRGQIDAQAGEDRRGFEKTYLGNQNQIGANYSARGAYDSSYRGNAQQTSTDTYKQQTSDYENDLGNKYADLGKFADTTNAGFHAQQDQVNKLFDAANQAGDVATLTSIKDALLSKIGELTGAKAGLKTNAQYRSSLNAIAPNSAATATALQSKLQSLAASSAPPEAKQEIAQGYINSANFTDQQSKDYWTNYYQQLLAQQAAPAQTPTAAPAVA